jgi:hypothetical protein
MNVPAPPVNPWIGAASKGRLIEYARSDRTRVIDVAARSHVDVVRHFEGDEAVTSRWSLEHLAQYLADECGQ